MWLATLLFLTVGAAPANAATVTTPTSCTNNAQPGTSALPITMSGAFTPAAPTAGATVTLSGATFTIDVPGGTLLAGYGLGLLSAGVNNIPAKVNLTILGSGTEQTSQTLPPISVTGTTTITDPTTDNKTSGDETATPLSVTATVPDSTWTATGPTVALSLGDSTTTAEVGPGGIIKVTFTCTPGTPSPAGCGDPPAADCTGTTPVAAQPFASSGAVETTTTTAGGTTTTTGATTTAVTTTPTSGVTTTVPVNAAPTEISGTAAYTGACRNSATPDVSELLFEASGRTLSPIAAGSAANLTNQSWKVTVPASVLQTGIGLGLLKPGDTPTGLATITVAASNTRQGTATANAIPLSIGPIAVDGAGQALAAVTTFAVPNMSFTSVGGDVAFAMASTSVEVSLGPVKVTFTCQPKAPVATIVTAAVRGTTGSTAGPTRVAGVSQTRQSSGSLARTGPSALVKIVLAIGLIDLGYLCWSATRPRRRELR